MLHTFTIATCHGVADKTRDHRADGHALESRLPPCLDGGDLAHAQTG